MKKNTLFSVLKYAGSLIADQFLAVISAILITEVFKMIPGGIGQFISYILCFFIYVALIYTNSWKRGSYDVNRIRLGYISKIRFKGILAGFIAIIPSFTLALLAYISEVRSVVFVDLLGVDLFTALNRIWQFPLNLFFEYVNNNPCLNLFLPLLVPIFSETGYVFGEKGISIKQIMIYKNDNN